LEGTRRIAPAGAAERDPEARLLLFLVTRKRELEQRHQAIEERCGRLMPEHEVADRRIAARERPKCLDVEGVLHESHIEDKVGALRQAVLVAKAHELHEHPRAALAVQGVERVAQVFDREVRRVDHLVRAGPQIDEQAPLALDRRLDATGRLERMAVPRFAVAPEQHLVRRVEVEEMGSGTGSLQELELRRGICEQRSASGVDDHGDARVAALPGYVQRRPHDRRRKVVEDVVAKVLEDLHRLRLPGAGEPGHDDEVGARAHP